MSNKQNFTADEWTKLLESVVLASMAVSAADPNGLWGTIREAFASRSAIKSAHEASNPLVKEVLTDFDSPEGRCCIQDSLRTWISGATPSDIVQRSLQTLREVAAILDSKAPGDAVAFKAWLGEISQQVAEASMEGGILGIGGVRVSENEKATLSDIARALGSTT
jgi:hypothetical protein